MCWQIKKTNQKVPSFVLLRHYLADVNFFVCHLEFDQLQKYFRRRMNSCLVTFPTVIVLLMIAGRNDKEHDTTMRKVLEWAQRYGVKFNFDKLQYKGNVISANGVVVDPKEVEAILQYPKPQSVLDIRRFLGMTNSLGPFPTNMSTVTAPIGTIWNSNETNSKIKHFWP